MKTNEGFLLALREVKTFSFYIFLILQATLYKFRYVLNKLDRIKPDHV